MRQRRRLEAIKAIDAFPKVEESVRVDESVSGGTVALVALGIILCLVVAEIMWFLRPVIEYKYEVDSALDAPLQINLDMTVCSPCSSIDADIMDALGRSAVKEGSLDLLAVTFELSDEEKRRRELLLHLQAYVRQQYHAVHELLWSSGWSFGRLRGDEGHASGPKDACRISGSVVVSKSQGNLHIVPGKHVEHLSRHAHVSTSDLSSLNLSHRIDHLSFGQPVTGLVYPLDGDVRVTQHAHHVFQYLVQAVPTQVDTSSAHVDTYQLSVTEHDRVLDHARGSHGSPGIFFKYDVDWLRVRVSESRPPWGQLLTRLVGIVGGVFATSGLLDRAVALLCCCWFQRRTRTPLPESVHSPTATLG